MIPPQQAGPLRLANGMARLSCLRCLARHAIQQQSPRAGLHSSLALRYQQMRRQSSSSQDQSASQKGKKQPPTPPPSVGKVLSMALKQGLTFKPLMSAFRGQNLRKLFRQSPEELVMAIALLIGSAGVIVYVVFAYFNYFQSKQFTAFPPHIAKSLRRALYYSNYSPDNQLALKYYKIAIQQCTEAAIDPFSNEFLGLRIQLAAWLEKIGSYKNSIEVLDTLLTECKEWVDTMERSVKEGKVDKDGRLIVAEQPPVKTEDPSTTSEGEGEVKVPAENLWGKRNRVLGKAVGISVKLGELLADEHVLQGDVAGERLVWAVETVLKEQQRRQVQGVKEGEGDWMSPEQIGGALEALGNHYESKSQHYLSAPLFLQAITLSPPKTCHTAVLMNNLAISLAQQPVAQAAAISSGPGAEPPTRAALLSSAREWALQARSTAQKVQGEDRTEECDEACAVALCNLGDIAAMTGDSKQAKKWFQDGLSLSQKIGFEPGVMQATDGIKRASSSSKKPVSS